MKRYILTLLAAALAATPVLAQNFAVKDATGTTITKAAVKLSDGSLADKNVQVGADGVEKGTSTNPTIVSGTVGVSGTVPISAASLPLPTGGATLAGQTATTTAITGSQATTGTLAATATTVTTTLPQITGTAGLAVSFGTTATNLFAANASRHFITVQVQGASDTTGTTGCWINGSGTATADANSLFIARGGYFESATHVGVGAISIICSAAATAVYSRQG